MFSVYLSNNMIHWRISHIYWVDPYQIYIYRFILVSDTLGFSHENTNGLPKIAASTMERTPMACGALSLQAKVTGTVMSASSGVQW